VLPAQDNGYRHTTIPEIEEVIERNYRQRLTYFRFVELVRSQGGLLPSDLPSDLLIVHRDQMTPALELPDSDVRKKNIPKDADGPLTFENEWAGVPTVDTLCRSWGISR